jgi:hypothetical protein
VEKDRPHDHLRKDPIPAERVDGRSRVAAMKWLATERAGYEVVLDRETPGYRRFHTRDPFRNRIELMQPDQLKDSDMKRHSGGPNTIRL